MDKTLQESFKGIQESFGKYVVAPVTQFGLGGFVFDVEGSTGIDLTADITDHFTEGNFTVQDHIAIRPKRIRLDTFVGEVVYRHTDSDTQPVQKIAKKLTVLNSYLPQITRGAQQAQSLFESGREDISLSKVLDTGLNLYALTKNILPPTTKQQQAYQYFKALMEQKILVSVQTPFEFCTNMAIEAIFATQDEESKYISNFSILLKEIRVVSTSVSPFRLVTDILDRAGIQNSPLVNGGKIQGSDVSPIESKSLFSSFRGLL